MIFITQEDGSIALLVSEPKRMEIARLLSSSASTMDDLRSDTLSPQEAQNTKKEATWDILQLHRCAQAMAGSRAREIYDASEEAESDIEQMVRLGGVGCALEVEHTA